MQKIVSYSFELPGNVKHNFEFRLDTETFEIATNAACIQPDWAKLDHHRCKGCPVSSAEYCPVALNICKVVMPMRDVVSYETVKCSVVTQERTYAVTTSAQEALRSLMIFVIAASACPQVDFLKPLELFHLPFMTLEEIISRIVSAYLLFQYFRKRQGLPFDCELTGLRKIFETLEGIGVAMAERLRSERMAGDAAINALVILHDFSLFVPLHIDDHLDILRSAFDPIMKRTA